MDGAIKSYDKPKPDHRFNRNGGEVVEKGINKEKTFVILPSLVLKKGRYISNTANIFAVVLVGKDEIVQNNIKKC
jgi:hypothetical protein